MAGSKKVEARERVDNLGLLMPPIRWFLKAARAAGIAPAAAMSDADIAGTAHSLGHALLATHWQHKAAAPTWETVYRQWEQRLSATGAVATSRFGVFGPEDRLELLTDNALAFEKRYELFRAARETVDISTFYIQADEVGRRTAQALVECAGRGVRVRLLADRITTERKTLENPKVLDLILFLRDAGVDFRLFRDPARPWDSSHRKLLIVDGRTLITGGRNYADHYAGGQWRDIDLLLTGPSVRCLQPFYEATFACAPGAERMNREDCIFQAAEPAAIDSNSPFIYLLECIRACRKTLDIENAYYLRHRVVEREIIEACRRGARVRVFTNSAESNDLDIINYRLYSGFPGLIEAGASLWLRRGKGRTLHPKYFVADGEWVGFGSSNLDFYSPRFCLELGIQVRDTQFGAMLTEWFERGISEADSLTDPEAARKMAESLTISRIFDRWFPDIQ